jgi:NADH:quinone reductase (non-electrogenic)
VSPSRLVIAGGGFAGVWAAAGAAAALERHGAEAEIALMTRDPWLTIRPRLYERAPQDVLVELAPVLGELGVRLELASVTAADLARRVLLAGGRELAFDALVLALGSRLAPPPPTAPGAQVHDADTPAGAARLWQALDALAGSRPAVAVAGGGLTGIELACEIATEIAGARVALLDAAPAFAAGYEPDARAEIHAALDRLGVELRSNARAEAVDERGVRLAGGGRVDADVVVWSAGLEAAPIELDPPVARDGLGRVVVDAELAPAGHAGVYAAGDLAAVPLAGPGSAPMSCQLAIRTGKVAGRNAAAHLLGRPAEAFAYDDYVTCLDLGAAGALFTRGWERRRECAGEEGKQRKRAINRSRIYPPATRAELLAAAAS